MENKAVIIYDPNSGLGVSDEVLERFQNRLKLRVYNTKLVLTKGPKHASQIISSSYHSDVVFSMGGDGTLNEVINGNLEREDRLTICPIPTGSCNDVASMLGYDKDLLTNLDKALNGTIKEIDIGTINNRAFTYLAGMGKFMYIPYETTRDKKSKIGYLAYIKEGVKEFFKPTKVYNIEVEADGIKLDGDYSLVLVSNSNHIAGVNGFHKDVLLDDEKFEVILCKSKNKGSLVTSFIDFYMGGNPKDFIRLRANDIKLNYREPLEKNFCIDGERLDDSNLTYHISASNKMNFLVPSDYNKKLFLNN